jgi:hypothetical protein
MCLLQKVKMLCKLDRGTRISAVGRLYEVKGWKFISSRSMKSKSEEVLRPVS